MKQNKYDDDVFFNKYSQMDRSVKGLEGAGEWHALKAMLPDLSGKRVLDLGCGFGWHCIYAVKNGAAEATGLDISKKMLAEAAEKSRGLNINYIETPLEDADFPADAYDLVLSSLAIHYLSSFKAICEKVYQWLVPGGDFVFSVEHSVFTAYGSQDWYYGPGGEKLHWPVDGYFTESTRTSVFLGEEVIKYHRTLTTYIGDLLKTGFEIRDVVEPQPSAEMLAEVPGMEDELRRPMMLLIAARKK